MRYTYKYMYRGYKIEKYKFISNSLIIQSTLGKSDYG